MYTRYALHAGGRALRWEAESAVLPTLAQAWRRQAAAAAAAAKASMATLPDHTVVGLPALSPTMTHGNLAQWHKKVRETRA